MGVGLGSGAGSGFEIGLDLGLGWGLAYRCLVPSAPNPSSRAAAWPHLVVTRLLTKILERRAESQVLA